MSAHFVMCYSSIRARKASSYFSVHVLRVLIYFRIRKINFINIREREDWSEAVWKGGNKWGVLGGRYILILGIKLIINYFR
jgi:hypothetical protein